MPQVNKQIRDLSLVSFLLCRNHQLLETIKTDEKHIEFIFKNTDEVVRDIDAFLGDEEVTIKLRSFTKKYKDLLFFAHNPGMINFTKKY